MSDFRKGDFEGVEFLAVAVRSIRIDQRHVGLLYKNSNGVVRFLHLFDTDDLRCEAPGTGLYWAEVGLNELNRTLLAELADIVAEKHAGEKVPFGIDFSGDGPSPLTAEGEWNQARSMTCATFILALFLAHGFQLVAPETWQARVEDEEYARAVLRDIVSPLDEKSFAADVREYRRIRPEEAAVAARGFDEPLPYCFQTVEPEAIKLVEALLDS